MCNEYLIVRCTHMYTLYNPLIHLQLSPGPDVLQASQGLYYISQDNRIYSFVIITAYLLFFLTSNSIDAQNLNYKLRADEVQSDGDYNQLLRDQ